MSLCSYKNALGFPGKGFHIHLFGIAIFDVLATVLLAIGLWYLLKDKVSFWLILVALMILAIFVHWIFCVDTTINRLLGLY